MRYAPSQIARVVVAQARLHAPAEVIRALADILLRRGQLRDFPLIRAAIDRELAEQGLVTVATAHPLPDSLQNQLIRVLVKSPSPRTIRFTVNQQLGDGYRISSARGVVERSTATILQTLTKHLTG